MIGAKHMDPILGVDIHIHLVPAVPAPIPTPLPNPFIGMVLDPMDYIPFIGATVYINGMPRAQAGTGGIALPPHLPIPGPLVPPAMNEAEIFMGSATVASDGDAQSRLGLMVLSCSTIGMPSPPRPKGMPAKSLVMPTSVVLSIPMGMIVLVGGPPTVSLMALGMRAAFALAGILGKFLRKAQRGAGKFGDLMRAITAKARKAGDKLADFLKLGAKGRARVNKAICAVTGHPVDIATGKVFTDRVDLELPGAIPFRWERTWYSTSTYQGPLGHGWHHAYDAGLYVTDEVVLYRTPDGRLVSLPPLPEGGEYFDRTERLTLIRSPGKYDGEYSIRGVDRITYRFRELRENQRAPLGTPREGGTPREHVLTRILDDVGNNLAFQYDAQGNLSEVIDCGGRSLQLTYDKRGRITAFTAPHPDKEGERFVVMQYVYDDRGNLTQTIDALGQPMTYAYERHLLVKETDRNGLSFYFQWDAKDENAKCVRTWGDGGIYDHKLTYLEDQSLTIVENSFGIRTQHFHDGGLVVKTIDARGGVVETEYNEFNQKVKETDPLGGVRTRVYDDRGNLVEEIDRDGRKLTLAYDERDGLVEAVDAGTPFTWQHDEAGRVIARKDPLGTTRYEYAGRWLSRIYDAAGNVTTIEYDSAGNIVAVTTPDGERAQWTHDRWGRSTKTRDPKGNVASRTFDGLARVDRVELADGNVRELEYDGEGNVIHARDRFHDVRFQYAGMNRLVARQEAGVTVRFVYDKEQRLVGVVNGEGRAYRFELDAGGEIQRELTFDERVRTYTRDVKGRAVRVSEPSGRFSEYAYDAVDRVTSITYADGTRSVFEYDKRGYLAGAGNEVRATRFERDALGRVTKEQQGKHWVANEYDATGLRVRVRSSVGLDQEIGRDVMGNTSRVSESSGYQASFKRDSLGLEIERTLPGGLRSRWQRDSIGRPTRHEVDCDGDVKRVVAYQWEPSDRLRLVIDGLKGPTRYEHDELDFLVSAEFADGTRELRAHDAVANLFKDAAKRDRKYGPAGELLESRTDRGVTHYEYDVDGNLVRKVEPNGHAWRYEWNAAGMMSRIVRPDGDVVAFTYDALGRRVSKSYRGQTTHWIWDGHVPLHEWVEGKLAASGGGDAARIRRERETDAAIKRREAELDRLLAQGPPSRGTREAPITWLFEPDTFAPMAKLVGGDACSILTDYLGTPVAMYDASGKSVWTAEMTPYGELRDVEGARWTMPFRYQGQYEDAETGLYYNRFRYYDPEVGSYVSRDPIGLVGSLALYSYASDPLGLTDPLGLSVADALASSMKSAGRGLEPGQTAHHIIQRNNPIADKSAAILQRNNPAWNRDSASNGAALWGTSDSQIAKSPHANRAAAQASPNYHAGSHLHGDKAQQRILNILERAEKMGMDPEKVLSQIGERMEAGKWCK